MPLTALEPLVAKKPTLISVKIDAETYRLVKTAAAWKGVSIADYLSAVVRPIAEKDLDRMQRDRKHNATDEE